MKKLAVLIGLLAVPVWAEQYPIIIGYLNNKLEGRIIFTTQKGNCEGKTNLVYNTKGGGEIAGIGCWYKVDDQLFVTWTLTGDFYSYPVDELIWSREWTEFSNK